MTDVVLSQPSHRPPIRADDVLCWLHIGDLHIDRPDAANLRDFHRIVEEANRRLVGGVDFAILPGDIADNGLPGEYDLVRSALADFRIPVHAIPGDHDLASGSLHSFYAGLGVARLPQAIDVAGRRCLFLDMVSAGRGGPDFRLGASQIAWLERELTRADRGGGSVVFMHTYPAHLADPAERRAIVDAFANHRVIVADIGHTHYNELANDGRVIYAATRSTGQIEEGEPGFSLTAVDKGGVASWRFKALRRGWPMVMISSPSDRRLATRPEHPAHVVRPQETFAIRALVFPSRGVAACRYRIDDGGWRAMTRKSERLWIAEHRAPAKPFVLAVEALDGVGLGDRDTIEVGVVGSFEAPARRADGSDADALGAWPDKGLLGTQLGPNRNGRKW